jgi:hypothetical protein
MPRVNLAFPSAILFAALALIVGGCEGGVLTIEDEGSGVLVTETRAVQGFTSVEVSAALNLDLTVDAAAAPEVTVTFDDNLIDRVVTRVSGNTLILEVNVPFNIIGAGDRRIEVIMNDLESLEASGATDVDASGTIPSYQLKVSGASDVNVAKLTATDVDVDLSGASSVDLFASGVVGGSISGASSLRVYGDPTSVLVDSRGASRVEIEE